MLKISESITNRSKLSMDKLTEPVVKSCIYIDNGVDIDIEIKNDTILISNNHPKNCDLRIEVDKWEELGLPKKISFERGNVNIIFSNNIIGWNIKGTSDSIIYVQRNQDIKNCTFEGKYIPIIITDGDEYWEITEDTPYLFEDGDFDAVTMKYTGKVIDEVFSNTIKTKSVMLKIPVGVDEGFMEEHSIKEVLEIFEETISKYSKLYSKFSGYIDVDIDY